jgi:hypothetical protein
MPSLPHTHLALYVDDTALLPSSWYRGADKSLARPGRKRLIGHLQPRRNWPTWVSNVLITHPIFRIWPRRTNTCSWTEKTTEREVGRAKNLSAPQYYLTPTQSRSNDPTQILHYMETPIKHPPNWNNSIFPSVTFPLPCPFQIHDIFVPWTSAVRYLGFALYSELLSPHQLTWILNFQSVLWCMIKRNLHILVYSACY